MWISTHYYLAKQIHHYIREKYQLDLRLDMLQYGSVKPDLHLNYINIPHYFDEGHSYWMEEVGQLLKEKKYQDTKEFSDKLGVILHFTADFFCYAHNLKELKEKVWPHLSYELKLHQAFIHYTGFQRSCLLASHDANTLIKNLRKSYLFSGSSLEKDIHFIYSASLSIADLMVGEVLLPSLKVS